MEPLEKLLVLCRSRELPGYTHRLVVHAGDHVWARRSPQVVSDPHCRGNAEQWRNGKG